MSLLKPLLLKRRRVSIAAESGELGCVVQRVTAGGIAETGINGDVDDGNEIMTLEGSER